MRHEPPSAEQAATLSEPSAEQLGEGTVKCREILGNLMDMAHVLAAMLAEQALAQQAHPEAAQKAVVVFNAVSQSIRRTIMLHEKLGRPARPPRARVLARRKIIRDVEDAIEAHAPAAEQESLHAELLERLDSPDLEEDLADRAIGEIVTDITRDLAITGRDDDHAGKRRIPHDIAILNARAAQGAGADMSENLATLLATAPPRPGPRYQLLSEEELAAMDMKTLMQRTGRLPASDDG